MSREKCGYAENLARLREVFPSREMLTTKDVAAFTGLDRHTVRRKIRFNEATSKISVQDLARQISC